MSEPQGVSETMWSSSEHHLDTDFQPVGCGPFKRLHISCPVYLLDVYIKIHNSNTITVMK